MPNTLLDDRALISVSGPEAEHLLQNIITTDLDQLAAGEARPGALLTPQGKILFDFLISRDGENVLLIECRADIADDFVRRLMLYRLRAKAEVKKLDQKLVRVSWEDDSGASQTDSTTTSALRDRRFAEPAQVWRAYGEATASDTENRDQWEIFRISNGIAESGRDYALSDVFPHDVLLDQNGGIGFRKGCYVGQEVVSRMQHRGTARRRVLVATADTDLPPPGTDILAGGRSVGTLGSTAGHSAIAIARIDKVKAAMDAGLPILAGDAALSLTIPAWAYVHLPGGRPGRGRRLMAADRAGAPPRAWQRMLSGRRLDLLDPSPLDIEISDIAHGLARVARWNGQTFGDHAFSVAQHSLLVETIFCVQQPEASPDQRMATLLHDAPEYVIGDMISPFKAVVGGDYKAVEQRLQHAIHLRFSLPPKLDEKTRVAIKRADQVAAYFEATVLAGFATTEAVRYFGRPNGISADSLDLACRPAKAAQAAFAKRFAAIEKERTARAPKAGRVHSEAS